MIETANACLWVLYPLPPQLRSGLHKSTGCPLLRRHCVTVEYGLIISEVDFQDFVDELVRSEFLKCGMEELPLDLGTALLVTNV